MGRLLQILIPIVLLSAAVAGCIGGDDGPSPTDNGNGNGENGNGNETNGNQTDDPAPRPNAAFEVTMGLDDGTPGPGPFVVRPGSNLTFVLDASPSTISEGDIEMYAWTVTTSSGAVVQGPGRTVPTFTFWVNSTNTPDYGIYTVELSVMSDRNELGKTTGYFTIHYENTFSFTNTMIGPGTDCSTPQIQGQGGIEGIVPGTYRAHAVRLAENASAISMTLTFDSMDPNAEVKLYLYPPDASIEDTNCDEAIAESDAGSGPVTLSTEDLAGPGNYPIRVQLIGLSLGEYDIDLQVDYLEMDVESITEEEEEEEEDEDEEGDDDGDG